MSDPVSRFREYLRHPFWQAVAILVVAWVLIDIGIPLLPGSALVPNSVVLQYMATVLVGVLIYVSDSEERWDRFKQPLHAVLVEPGLRPVRAGLFVVLPVLVGFLTWGQVRATVSAPPNLRSIHPAPPSEITFRGQRMVLAGLDNPLRKEGDLAEHIAVGKELYFQNCMPCHGDYLDGQGHFASGLNPLPLNFQDVGTIAQLTESFVFWRVAKGGPGLPREATPWNSAMPAWEDFMTEEEIWAVVLFLYEQTGHRPRTWEHGGAEAESGGGHD
jgi:mono/diheme cytochrome c family protein